MERGEKIKTILGVLFKAASVFGGNGVDMKISVELPDGEYVRFSVPEHTISYLCRSLSATILEQLKDNEEFRECLSEEALAEYDKIFRQKN